MTHTAHLGHSILILACLFVFPELANADQPSSSQSIQPPLPTDSTQEMRTAREAIRIVPLPTGKDRGSIFFKRPDGTPPDYAPPADIVVAPNWYVYIIEEQSVYGVQRVQAFSTTGELNHIVDLQALSQHLQDIGRVQTGSKVPIPDVQIDFGRARPDGGINLHLTHLPSGSREIAETFYAAFDHSGAFTAIRDSLTDQDRVPFAERSSYRSNDIDIPRNGSKLYTGETRSNVTGTQTYRERYEMRQAMIQISRVDPGPDGADSVGTVRLPSQRTYESGFPVDLPTGIPFWYPGKIGQSSTYTKADTLYALGFSLPRNDSDEEPQYHLVKVNLKEYFWHETHHGPDYLKKYTALHEKSADGLRLLRNEIFARYGYTFSNPKLQQHFEQTDWYEPDPDFSTDRLSEEETWLAQRLKELEEVKREEELEAEGAE